MKKAPVVVYQGAKLGALLRSARQRCNISQMDLAHLAGISPRHLGFVENGRSHPSKEVLLALSSALQMSCSEANALLRHAGYAAHEETAEPQHRLQALLEVARAHPYPAVVLNADWYSYEINQIGLTLCKVLMPKYPWNGMHTNGSGLDMIAAIGHPDGLLSSMIDARDAAVQLLHRLELETWARPALRDRVDKCRRQLSTTHGTLENDIKLSLPRLNFAFDSQWGELRFFTVQCLPALPQDIYMNSSRAELWFPDNDHTKTIITRHLTDGGAGL